MRSRSVRLACRLIVVGVALALASRLAPLQAQAVPGAGGACTTEVTVYVEKTESLNARETARTVLNLLNQVPNLVNVTVVGFAGEIPVSTFAAANQFPMDVESLLDQTILQEPSSAFTLAPDYLALFGHIQETVRQRPTIADLRVFIVISDFSMRRSEDRHEHGLPARVVQQLGTLRRALVASGNQRLLAVRTRPRQEPSPSLQNDLLGEVARNFTLVEDEAQIPGVLSEVFGGETPLQLALEFNPTTSIYSLTLANPSCTPRENIEYHTIAAGTNARLSIPWCPTTLRPGETGTCTFAPAQIVLPPLPDTCLNVWLRAESARSAGAALPGVAGAAATAAATAVQGRLVGTANDPILVGNCVFLSKAELDSTKSLATEENPDVADCARAAVGRPDQFLACLRVRGRVEGSQVRLRIFHGEDPADPVMVDEAIPAAAFNGNAFHGGERFIPRAFSLSRWDADWLCSASADRTQRKLRIEIAGPTGVLASGRLGRVPPRDKDPLDLWRRLAIPLVLLLLLSGFVANYMRTASLSMLGAVLLVLGLGLFALIMVILIGSGVGDWLSSLLGIRSILIVTGLLVLLALCFWILYAKGFFDRQLTAAGKTSLVSRVPLWTRRRKRFRRTVLVVSGAVLGIAIAIALLWFDPREIDDCGYTLIDLPTNTAVPPVNLPPAQIAQ
ncbi:MAG: hypothetical protein ABUT39_27335 [Acidobacteriota bacterium]